MKIVILVRVWKHFGWSKRKIFKKSYNFRISYFFILTHSTTATITIKNTALASPSNHEKGLSTSPRFRYCHFVVYAVPLHYAQCVPSTACTDIRRQLLQVHRIVRSVCHLRMKSLKYSNCI